MSSRLAVLAVLLFIALIVLVQPLFANPANDAQAQERADLSRSRPYLISKDGSLTAPAHPVLDNTAMSAGEASNKMPMIVTAYSSSPDETSEHPWITAAGTYASYGVAASNSLPFGTRLRLPQLFGNQVFVVEDRMNARFSNRLDIWLPSKIKALKFGKQFTEVEIL